ncbi:MAG: HlyC/CorC family transporter [Deltaproteobacteria bacterium]|nr:HlyC/CorC family transporter [Deltaproteobacteria bacterium]MBK8238237.1 HlyC/CorC family transporter [Deltaproteobacteria bacterium]MBP7290592.1 HlyC/CorC family transporter [Nannocystaceae bacterium]
MTDADLLAALVMVLCLGGSMFFSGSETAITSFGDHQWRKLVEDGGRPARVAREWVERPVRVLSTILVGNNLVNTLIGAVTTATVIRHVGGGELSRYSVPLAVFVAAGLTIVFGEILPKAVGKLYAHRVALPALTALQVFGKAFAPLTFVTTKLTDLVLRTADGDSAAQRVTSEDLDYLVKVGQREGSIPADQAALLRRVFQFDDKIVRDIMVPRDRVTAIDLAWSVPRIIEVAQASGHSRLPAYEGDLGRIRGVLHIKQLVGAAGPDRETVQRLMRPPLFVSESLMISDLLERFKERRVHLAIVVDDGGHTVGVVTLEDVLEQIVGHIFDESDHAPQPAQDGLGIHYFDGQTSLRKLEEMFDIEFEEDEGVSSVGDLLTQLAGQMPIAGSLFVVEGLRLKVLAADDRRVLRVSVEQVQVDDDDDDDE